MDAKDAAYSVALVIGAAIVGWVAFEVFGLANRVTWLEAFCHCLK